MLTGEPVHHCSLGRVVDGAEGDMVDRARALPAGQKITHGPQGHSSPATGAAQVASRGAFPGDLAHAKHVREDRRCLIGVAQQKGDAVKAEQGVFDRHLASPSRRSGLVLPADQGQ